MFVYFLLSLSPRAPNCQFIIFFFLPAIENKVLKNRGWFFCLTFFPSSPIARFPKSGFHSITILNPTKRFKWNNKTLARFFQQNLLWISGNRTKQRKERKNEIERQQQKKKKTSAGKDFRPKLKIKVILYCHEFYTLIVLFHCSWFFLCCSRFRVWESSDDDRLLFQIMTNQILFLSSSVWASLPSRRWRFMA